MPLQASDRRPFPNTPAPLSGVLGTFSFIDLIQMIANAGKTGQLSIFDGNLAARLNFNSGVLVDAKAGELSGIEAFDSIMQLKDGAFEFRTQPPWRKMTIRVSLTQLLLDNMRRLDESQRDRSAQQESPSLAS